MENISNIRLRLYTVPAAGYFLFDQKVTKKSSAPTDSEPPSYPLTSVFEVGVFDWTDDCLRAAVFWAYSVGRRRETSYFNVALVNIHVDHIGV